MSIEIRKSNKNDLNSQLEPHSDSPVIPFVADCKITAAKALVESLDFTLQIKKMIEYHGLDAEYVQKCMEAYKNFLILCIAYQDQNIEFVPNSMIDEAWHQHILDTEKYMEDCQLLFGKYLHHYPYLGLRGEEDVKVWKQASSQTQTIYEHYFGQRIYQGDAITARACKAQKCWSDSGNKGNSSNKK